MSAARSPDLSHRPPRPAQWRQSKACKAPQHAQITCVLACVLHFAITPSKWRASAHPSWCRDSNVLLLLLGHDHRVCGCSVPAAPKRCAAACSDASAAAMSLSSAHSSPLKTADTCPAAPVADPTAAAAAAAAAEPGRSLLGFPKVPPPLPPQESVPQNLPAWPAAAADDDVTKCLEKLPLLPPAAAPGLRLLLIRLSVPTAPAAYPAAAAAHATRRGDVAPTPAEYGLNRPADKLPGAAVC